MRCRTFYDFLTDDRAATSIECALIGRVMSIVIYARTKTIGAKPSSAY